MSVAGNAILYKRAGGYQNTKLHGYLMAASFGLALFGWYVIYSNKSASGKMHNTSWHAWVGLACIGLYTLMMLSGLLALHPDYGRYKANKTIRKHVRKAHTLAGRLATGLGFLACAMGWYTMKGEYSTMVLSLPIIAFAWLLLR